MLSLLQRTTCSCRCEPIKRLRLKRRKLSESHRAKSKQCQRVLVMTVRKFENRAVGKWFFHCIQNNSGRPPWFIFEAQRACWSRCCLCIFGQKTVKGSLFARYCYQLTTQKVIPDKHVEKSSKKVFSFQSRFIYHANREQSRSIFRKLKSLWTKY